MTTVAEIKKQQGYSNTPLCCGSCRHYTSVMAVPKWMLVENASAIKSGRPEPFPFSSFATEEKNRRCTIGGFAVKKMGHCKRWSQAKT